jgi:hypothetical protein
MKRHKSHSRTENPKKSAEASAVTSTKNLILTAPAAHTSNKSTLGISDVNTSFIQIRNEVIESAGKPKFSPYILKYQSSKNLYYVLKILKLLIVYGVASL